MPSNDMLDTGDTASASENGISYVLSKQDTYLPSSSLKRGRNHAEEDNTKKLKTYHEGSSDSILSVDGSGNHGPTSRSATVSSTSPHLSRFEQLPAELRHMIYSYLGFPVAGYIWGRRCKCWLSQRCPECGIRTGIPPPVGHQDPSICSTEENKVRILCVDFDLVWGRSMLAKIDLDSHYYCYSYLNFGNELLMTKKSIRDEIATLFFDDRVQIHFGVWGGAGLRDITRLQTTFVTSILMKHAAAFDNSNLWYEKKTLIDIANHCPSLKHLTYPAIGYRLAPYTYAELQGLAKGFGSVAHKCVKLQTVQITTIHPLFHKPSSERWVKGGKRRQTTATSTPGWTLSIAMTKPELDTTMVLQSIEHSARKEKLVNWCMEVLLRFNDFRVQFCLQDNHASVTWMCEGRSEDLGYAHLMCILRDRGMC